MNRPSPLRVLTSSKLNTRSTPIATGELRKPISQPPKPARTPVKNPPQSIPPATQSPLTIQDINKPYFELTRLTAESAQVALDEVIRRYYRHEDVMNTAASNNKGELGFQSRDERPHGSHPNIIANPIAVDPTPKYLGDQYFISFLYIIRSCANYYPHLLRWQQVDHIMPILMLSLTVSNTSLVIAAYYTLVDFCEQVHFTSPLDQNHFTVTKLVGVLPVLLKSQAHLTTQTQRIALHIEFIVRSLCLLIGVRVIPVIISLLNDMDPNAIKQRLSSSSSGTSSSTLPSQRIPPDSRLSTASSASTISTSSSHGALSLVPGQQSSLRQSCLRACLFSLYIAQYHSEQNVHQQANPPSMSSTSSSKHQQPSANIPRLTLTQDELVDLCIAIARLLHTVDENVKQLAFATAQFLLLHINSNVLTAIFDRMDASLVSTFISCGVTTMDNMHLSKRFIRPGSQSASRVSSEAGDGGGGADDDAVSSSHLQQDHHDITPHALTMLPIGCKESIDNFYTFIRSRQKLRATYNDIEKQLGVIRDSVGCSTAGAAGAASASPHNQDQLQEQSHQLKHRIVHLDLPCNDVLYTVSRHISLVEATSQRHSPSSLGLQTSNSTNSDPAVEIMYIVYDGRDHRHQPVDYEFTGKPPSSVSTSTSTSAEAQRHQYDGDADVDIGNANQTTPQPPSPVPPAHLAISTMTNDAIQQINPMELERLDRMAEELQRLSVATMNALETITLEQFRKLSAISSELMQRMTTGGGAGGGAGRPTRPGAKPTRGAPPSDGFLTNTKRPRW